VIDLFISHAKEDDTVVDRIYDVLQKRGIRGWADHKDVKPSHAWNTSIQKAMNECQAGLFVSSGHSVDSRHCTDECLSILDNQAKPLFVVRVDSIDPTQIHYWLKTIQYIDLTDDFELGMSKLVDAFEEFLVPSEGSVIDLKSISVAIATPDAFTTEFIKMEIARNLYTRTHSTYDSIANLNTNCTEEVGKFPDVIVVDVESLFGERSCMVDISQLRKMSSDIRLVGLITQLRHEYVSFAVDLRFNAILLKRDVGHLIASAIVYQMNTRVLIVSATVQSMTLLLSHPYANRAKILPAPRQFPSLTRRQRQALELTVLYGMSAKVAALELGIGYPTIRSHINDAYDILTTEDNTAYPTYLSREQVAYTKLTSLQPRSTPRSNSDHI
jgi:DNA-binding NarL/FixJ family response regulator